MSDLSSQGPSGRPSQREGNSTLIQRLLFFFRSHPVVCLLLLSPGIPEYLSSSSPLNAIVLDPIQFIFQLLLNLGLYGPGVLLVREAKFRWGKGWASVLLLGAAYGILEEGIAVSTFFNPSAGPVGALGYYGHWLGVSWIWVAGIIQIHIIYSISLPIILLGLAIPSTREKSFLDSRKKLLGAFGILGIDVAALFLLVFLGEHFWMGWSAFFGSFLAIGILVYLARKAPRNALLPSSDTPRRGPRVLAIVGALFYPSILFLEFGGMHALLSPALVFCLVVLCQAIFLLCVRSLLGQRKNERNLIALSLGLILPIVVFGVVAEIRLPLTLIADLAMFFFFRMLFQRYKSDQARAEDLQDYIAHPN